MYFDSLGLPIAANWSDPWEADSSTEEEGIQRRRRSGPQQLQTLHFFQFSISTYTHEDIEIWYMPNWWLCYHFTSHQVHWNSTTHSPTTFCISISIFEQCIDWMNGILYNVERNHILMRWEHPGIYTFIQLEFPLTNFLEHSSILHLEFLHC